MNVFDRTSACGQRAKRIENGDFSDENTLVWTSRLMCNSAQIKARLELD